MVGNGMKSEGILSRDNLGKNTIISRRRERSLRERKKYLFCFYFMYVGSFINSLHRVSHLIWYGHYSPFIDEKTDSKEFFGKSMAEPKFKACNTTEMRISLSWLSKCRIKISFVRLVWIAKPRCLFEHFIEPHSLRMSFYAADTLTRLSTLS